MVRSSPKKRSIPSSPRPANLSRYSYTSGYASGSTSSHRRVARPRDRASSESDSEESVTDPNTAHPGPIRPVPMPFRVAPRRAVPAPSPSPSSPLSPLYRIVCTSISIGHVVVSVLSKALTWMPVVLAIIAIPALFMIIVIATFSLLYRVDAVASAPLLWMASFAPGGCVTMCQYLPQVPGCRVLLSQEWDSRVSPLAHVTTRYASQSLDVFTAISNLRARDKKVSNHVDLWELSGQLESLERIPEVATLARQVHTLGDSTRDVRTHTIRINAKAMAAFGWIFEDFQTLADIYASGGFTGSNNWGVVWGGTSDPEELVNSLVEKALSDVRGLQFDLDVALPVVEDASALGSSIITSLSREVRRRGNRGYPEKLWDILLGLTGYRGQTVRRDLKIMGTSLNSLQELRRAFEDLKEALIEYETQLGEFQRGLSMTHSIGQNYNVAYEVEALIRIVSSFRESAARARVIPELEGRER